jgi:hypothetical protein
MAASAGACSFVLLPENRSFGPVRPAFSQGNHGISARIGRKTTPCGHHASLWLRFLLLFFNNLTSFWKIRSRECDLARPVQTDATIARLYVFIPNGSGEQEGQAEAVAKL